MNPVKRNGKVFFCFFSILPSVFGHRPIRVFYTSTCLVLSRTISNLLLSWYHLSSAFVAYFYYFSFFLRVAKVQPWSSIFSCFGVQLWSFF